MEDETRKPFVSALIVTRNEQAFIERALMSLINQTYPKDCYEIIIADGESTDDTLKIVKRLAQKYKTDTFDIRVVNNSKHILAAGWNLGIKNAKGEYVVRIDAHSEAADNFIEKNVKTICSVPDVICVGGKLTTKSLDNDNDIISKVLSSSFGVGNSSFRVSECSCYADTAVYGLYKKNVFDKVGFFNEQYIRNQDIELHSRMRAVGGKFYFNPEINCIYYSRNTVKKMAKQAFGNGKWNMVLLKYQNSALRLRHLVPFAFIIYLIVSAILGFHIRFFWIQEIAVLILHLILGTVAASRKTNRIAEILKMPFLFLLLHISYGLGYLAGIFTIIH